MKVKDLKKVFSKLPDNLDIAFGSPKYLGNKIIYPKDIMLGHNARSGEDVAIFIDFIHK